MIENIADRDERADYGPFAAHAEAHDGPRWLHDLGRTCAQPDSTNNAVEIGRADPLPVNFRQPSRRAEDTDGCWTFGCQFIA
jgi:hypothetical protein